MLALFHCFLFFESYDRALACGNTNGQLVARKLKRGVAQQRADGCVRAVQRDHALCLGRVAVDENDCRARVRGQHTGLESRAGAKVALDARPLAQRVAVEPMASAEASPMDCGNAL